MTLTVFTIIVSLTCAVKTVRGSTGSLVDDDSDGSYNQSKAFHDWLTRTMLTYDSRLRPFSDGGPLRISVGLNLIGISSVNKANTEVTMEMFFHETWTDERLSYDENELGVNPLTLPLDAPRFLWIPDTTFLNAVHSLNPQEGSVSHLYYIKLYANSTVQYSRRLSITADCQMDLTMYPFDHQACKLLISSYGWTVDNVVYDWPLVPTVSIDKISLPDFYVTHYLAKVVNMTFVAGVYSVPQLCIGLKRRAGFCFVQIFVPATSVVASSWIALWLENATHFADIISIIAAIIFLSYSYNSVMPRVSYVKAMDIYLAACFIFALLSLVKLAVMKYMHKRIHRRKEKLKAAVLALFNNVNEQLPLLGPARDSIVIQDDTQYSSAPLAIRRPSAVIPHHSRIQSMDFESYEGDSECYDLLHDTFWKCTKMLHVSCQLVLPLAFAAFGIFYFALYPSLQPKRGLCE